MRDQYQSWLAWRVLTWTVLVLCAVAALSGCAGRSALPPSAPEAVEVLVPVVRPCEVTAVPLTPLPSAGGVPLDIYGAVQRILADRQVLLGDVGNLVAANTDPCPEIVQ